MVLLNSAPYQTGVSMRSMIVKFRNSRIEFWLSLATLALFVYTFIAQRRTNIYALCRIDPVSYTHLDVYKRQQILL